MARVRTTVFHTAATRGGKVIASVLLTLTVIYLSVTLASVLTVESLLTTTDQ